MTAYAIADMREVSMGPEIVTYLERIDETLAPYGGKFIVHGGKVTEVEGSWSSTIIIIKFPDREQVKAWYESPAYQAILPLRTENSVSNVIVVDGVDEDHRATDVLKAPAS